MNRVAMKLTAKARAGHPLDHMPCDSQEDDRWPRTAVGTSQGPAILTVPAAVVMAHKQPGFRRGVCRRLPRAPAYALLSMQRADLDMVEKGGGCNQAHQTSS